MTRSAADPARRETVNGVCCAAPILLSIMALTLVVQGIIQYGGAIPSDEGINATVFRILMAVQIPLIALFAVTADWRARTRTLRMLAMQVGGFLAAMAAVAAWTFAAA